MGDYNLDLLKCENHGPTMDFLNILFSQSFWPLITRPTRCQNHSHTLIDNILTNNLDHKSGFIYGIILNDISDHYPIFHICHNIPLNTSVKPIIRRNFNHYCKKFSGIESFRKITPRTLILSSLRNLVKYTMKPSPNTWWNVGTIIENHG